jgi:mono/diheme cytochrome c family protein
MILFNHTDAWADGKALYEKKCAKCHGTTGAGDGSSSSLLAVKPTAFNDKAAMEKITDEEIFKAIKEGGTSVGKSKLMQANPSLSDDDIKSLVKYVRSLAN